MLIIIIIFALSVYVAYSYYKNIKINNINSFEECKKAGYSIAESYPEKCYLPNNKSFTRVIDEGVACTMDVKECSNGQFVGRVAPDCEFASCSE